MGFRKVTDPEEIKAIMDLEENRDLKENDRYPEYLLMMDFTIIATCYA